MRELFAKILPGDLILAAVFVKVLAAPFSFAAVAALVVAGVIAYGGRVLLDEIRRRRTEEERRLCQIEDEKLAVIRNSIVMLDAKFTDFEKKLSLEKIGNAFGRPK